MNVYEYAGDLRESNDENNPAFTYTQPGYIIL